MNQAEKTATLRARAEAAYRARIPQSREVLTAPTSEATERLLHELQVHQIELEMQNEELQRVRLELEASQAHYVELYDHAPVGYCTVNETGAVIHANLTLATQLGVARVDLQKQPFTRFISNEDQDIFFLMRRQLLAAQAEGAEPAPQPSLRELRLERSDGTPIWVELVGKAAKGAGAEPVLRFVVSECAARRAAEATVRRAAETQADILDAIPAHVALLDHEGLVVAANEGWRRFAGGDLQGSECFVGHNYLQVCDAASGSGSNEATAAAAGIRQVLRGEAEHYTLDYPCDSPAEQLWFRLLVTPLRRGELAGAVVTHLDITQLKLAQAKLTQASELLERTGEMAKVGGWELDLRTNDVTYSRETARLHEVEFADVVEKLSQAQNYYPPEAWPAVQAAVQAAIDEGTPYDFESPFVTAKGRRIWVRVQGFPVMKAGKAIQLRGTFQDITARKEAEEKLRDLNSHLQATLDAIPDLLFEVDSNGRLNGYRAHRADLLAAPPEVFLGKTIAEVLPPAATEACMNALREAALQGRSAGATYSLPLPRGETWFELSIATMPDTGAAVRNFIVLTRDITARKAAEAAVIASEARFRAIIDASPIPMALNDEAMRVTFLNPAFVRTFGYELADIPTLDHWWPLAYPDAAYRQWVIAAWGMELTRAARTGTPFSPLELTIRGKDGGERIALASAAPLSEAFAGTHLVLLHDITVSKQVDTELRRSRAEAVAMRDDLLASQKANIDLRAALDAHAIVAVTDARGRITFVNDKFCAISQYSREELLGQDHRLISSGRHSKEFIRDLWNTIRAGRVWQGELNNRAKDGTLYWVNTTIVPFLDSNGHIRQYVAIRKDITARKLAEAQLQVSEERFRQLAENIREVFWITDATKHEMLYISPAYEEIWGRPTQELYQNADAWLDAIHPDDRGRIRHAAETKQAQGLYAETYRIQRPDGTTRWIHDKAFPVLGPTGEVERIVGMAEDITHRTQLEEQLRQAHKMEAIGTLAGGIAHDFNNLLATIIANLHIAESELESGHPAVAGLAQIGKASARAVRLIEGILSFSRMKPRELHELDVGPIVSEAAELLRATLPAGISLLVRTGNHLRRVLGDATEIHQIVLNLGTNAWQAMEGSPGEIRISIETEVLGEALPSAHPSLRPGPYIRLTVEDSGKGMEQATIARIFDPFFTTKEVGVGTGLGLSVVHGIVTSMGGTVTVDSELGRGTKFSVFIPQVERNIENPAPLPARSPVPRGQGQHLLLVEDEAGLLWATKRILERQGYRVTAFGNASAALSALKAEPGAFDVLITDQNMPGFSGLEVAREARRHNPALPIVMTSGALVPAFLAEASASGVAHVLRKPFHPGALCELVHSLVSSAGSTPAASRGH